SERSKWWLRRHAVRRKQTCANTPVPTLVIAFESAEILSHDRHSRGAGPSVQASTKEEVGSDILKTGKGARLSAGRVFITQRFGKDGHYGRANKRFLVKTAIDFNREIFLFIKRSQKWQRLLDAAVARVENSGECLDAVVRIRGARKLERIE